MLLSEAHLTDCEYVKCENGSEGFTRCHYERMGKD